MKPRLLRVDRRWRDRPGLRIALATMALAGLLLLLAWQLRASDAGPVAAAATPAAPAAAPLQGPSRRVSAAAQPDAPSQFAAPGSPVPEGFIEVCGRPPIARDKDDREALATLRRLEIETVGPEYRRWVSAMQQHAQPRVRAAGWVLAAQQAQGEQYLAAEVALQACGKELGCQQRVAKESRERGRGARRPPVDALARLALVADDTAVYALAAQVCAARPQPDGSPCQQLSIAQWARLDPDNMGTWLRLAQQAEERKDGQQLAEALHRAALASRQQHHEGLLIEALDATLPADVHPMTRFHAQVNAVGAYTTLLMPAGSPALQYCKADLLQDNNRRQSCNALAQNLVERGSSLLDLVTGTAIGERAGWPPQRLAELRETRAVMQAVSAAATVHENILGCAATVAMQRYFSEWATLGELATARAQVARASPQDLSQAREAFRRTQAAAAAQAASR